MAVVKLGQGVVFRPGTAHDERWGPGQFLSGIVVSINQDDASLVLFPDTYPPYYETRVKRDDSLSVDRSWTPAVGEDQTMPEAPVDGQIYGRRNQAWYPVTGSGQTGISSIVISDIQPEQPLVGMAWFDTTINNLYIFEQGRWIEPAHVNPPVAVAVNVTPPVISGNVAIGAVLTCTTGDWTGMPISYAYQWRRGDSPIVGASSNTYTIVLADLNFEITCAVSAINLIGQSQPMLSNALTIASPTNLGAPVVTGEVAIGGVLICSEGLWGNNPLSISYQWMRGLAPLDGENANTYVIVAGDIDSELSCVVSAANLIGSTPISSNVIAITAPANIGLPSISGEALNGLTLIVSNGLWTGLPTNYAYEWRRDGVVIAGVTGNMYTLIEADVENDITCVVTATNALGSASATSNTITPKLPVNSVAPVVVQMIKPENIAAPENNGLIGYSHNCSTGTWTETSLTFYTFQWKRDGVDIAGMNQSTYAPSGLDIGKTVTCRVRNNDPNGFTDALSNGIFIPAYAKFDPATKLNVTLSGSNDVPDIRAAHVGTVDGGAKTTTLKSTGKWFIQCVFHQLWYPNSGVGFLLSTGTLADMEANQNCIKVRLQLGEIWVNGAYSGKRIGGLAGGHSMDMAIDLDNSLVWFRTDNGPWNEPLGFPTSGYIPGVSGGIGFAAGSFTPAICFDASTFGTTQDVTFSFGNSIAASEIPAGFSRGWLV